MSQITCLSALCVILNVITVFVFCRGTYSTTARGPTLIFVVNTKLITVERRTRYIGLCFVTLLHTLRAVTSSLIQMNSATFTHYTILITVERTHYTGLCFVTLLHTLRATFAHYKRRVTFSTQIFVKDLKDLPMLTYFY
jgi:hypothetical protein